MNALRIGIVEDEILIAKDVERHLVDMGHAVTGIYPHYKALADSLAAQQPDLFLVDIRLKGEKSGLKVAQLLKEQYGIPFFFLTSSTDSKTIQQAMRTLPVAYLTKPFTYDDLFIAMELAKAKIQSEHATRKKVEIQNGFEYQMLLVDEILYLEAARSYVTIHQKDGELLLRKSMGNLMEAFDEGDMVRVHRSYAVNPINVESVSANKVIVGGKKIPLSTSYKESFLAMLRGVHA